MIRKVAIAKMKKKKKAPSGFEPLTSGLLDQRSNQLS